MVLASRSDVSKKTKSKARNNSNKKVFRAMFEGGFSESRSNEMEIKEVDSTSLQLFVEFLYTDKIREATKRNPTLLRSLLVLANRYDVKVCNN